MLEYHLFSALKPEIALENSFRSNARFKLKTENKKQKKNKKRGRKVRSYRARKQKSQQDVSSQDVSGGDKTLA